MLKHKITKRKISNKKKTQPGHKFKEINITGDGNCLFRALSMALKGDEEYHLDVRFEIMDYIKANEVDFKD